jgi:hypothetical protein
LERGFGVVYANARQIQIGETNKSSKRPPKRLESLNPLAANNHGPRSSRIGGIADQLDERIKTLSLWRLPFRFPGAVGLLYR